MRTFDRSPGWDVTFLLVLGKVGLWTSQSGYFSPWGGSDMIPHGVLPFFLTGQQTLNVTITSHNSGSRSRFLLREGRVTSPNDRRPF